MVALNYQWKLIESLRHTKCPVYREFGRLWDSNDFPNNVAYHTHSSNSVILRQAKLKPLKLKRGFISCAKRLLKYWHKKHHYSEKKLMTPKYQCFHGIRKWQTNTDIYPGQGVGETWLGADGATVTLEHGVVSNKGDGWCRAAHHQCLCTDIRDTSEYTKFIIWGNNQTYSKRFSCYQKAY